MPKTCFVPFCKNKEPMAGVHFFSITPARCRSWLMALGRDPDEQVSHHNVVCSIHFRSEDFIKPGRLMENAVPRLHLRPKKSSVALKLETRFGPPGCNVSTQSSTVSEHVSQQAPTSSNPPNVQGSTSSDSLPQQAATSSNPLNVQGSTSSDSLHQQASASSGDLLTAADDFENKSDSASTTTTASSEDNIFQQPRSNNQGLKRKASSVINTSSSDSLGYKGTPKKRRRVLRLDHCYHFSPRKFRNVLTESRKVKSSLSKKLKVAKQRITRLKLKVKTLHALVAHLRNKKFINEEAKNVIEKSFSGVPAAILKRMFTNAERNKRTRAKFAPELRAFAMTLSFYSTKAYEYVRHTFHLALPSLSAIRSWMSNIECLPGFSETAFNTMIVKVKDLKNIAEKQKTKYISPTCALMLDEMAIKKQIDFIGGKCWGYIDLGSEISDDNLECATEALVLMVVALNGGWKLQIGYFLIHSISGAAKANIVRQALIKLHEVGVNIISVTCDGPNANFAMMHELGAKVNDVWNIKPFFNHPSTNAMVFVILDACHMLKLLRNCWAILKVLVDDIGGLIDFALIEKLHALQESEGLRFGNKLRKAHINWERQKMKVNLAAQTLSNSVADAIEFLQKKLGHTEFLNAEPTIRFLRKVNNLFDLLNSRNFLGKGCHTPLKPATENYWRPILTDSIEYLQKLQTQQGRALHSTQYKTPIRGFIITILSCLGIYDTYVTQDPLKYLLTYKLSQDHLELFFCSIRARNGWNNNPTAFQFYHTFKRLLMRHDLRGLKGNITMQDATNILWMSETQNKTKKQNLASVTIDDISVIKRYGLDATDVEINEHDYAIPHLPALSLLTQNVVGYIAGFVVKMMKRHIKCGACTSALVSVPESSSTVNDALLLIDQKDRGGLVRPSANLMSVLFTTEKYIKKLLLVTDQKIPVCDNFYEIFCQVLAMKIFGQNKLFGDLDNHVLNECSVTEEHHVMRLIKKAILCYSKIRFHHVARIQTENIRGELIRKKLSKLILFSNQ